MASTEYYRVAGKGHAGPGDRLPLDRASSTMPKVEAIPNTIPVFQHNNCRGCKFADKAKVSTGEPCCTYAFSLDITDSTCHTRRE